jgi:uncharacterized phage protein (TIGR01671 family)
VNRPIKFRGKRIDDGTWVYGSYQADVMCLNKHTIIYSDNEGFYCEDEVIPETVGQFTGLHDRNGKEVYEGDIIRNHEGDVAEVKYVIEHATYMARLVNPHQYHYITTDGKLKICEVIGNIYEHPELLG